MSEFKDRKTPGVYSTESNAFPPSIVGVQTAVPAFIGYTEKAEINGQPAFNKALRIGSIMDFETCFGRRYDEAVYDINEQLKLNPEKENYDFKVQWQVVSPPVPRPPDGEFLYYYLQDRPNSRFNLYDSMKLFYANGGGNCYVVSVGDYKSAQATGINQDDLKRGLDVIKEQAGPTMLVIPDAVLLPGSGNIDDATQRESPSSSVQPQWSAQFGYIVEQMLEQCEALEDRVAILDVYSSLSVKDQPTLDAVINQFRAYITRGTPSYGMAYFPFLHTGVVEPSDFTYKNMSTPEQLQAILRMENQTLYGNNPATASRWQQVEDFITAMADTTDPAEVARLNQNLTAALPLLADIERVIVEKNSVLPPSAAIAGVYTYIDGTRGVWNAPANISLTSVDRPTYKLNDTQQGGLNMPVDGKAIDALREFVGRGVVVWGARTLDGNSNDWRYIQVRRTVIYVEQSIKNALNAFAFAPNDANTWVTVISMISNFLTNLWSQGGLMGAKASDAFTVQCGLGSTMTGQDILNGYMIVQVALQMIHPAEFIELMFNQKMESVA